MTTKWNKRKQALLDGKPQLEVEAPGRVNSAIPGPGKPVPEGYRGTEYSPRNPMYDTEPLGQDESKNPIRTRLRQKGVR